MKQDYEITEDELRQKRETFQPRTFDNLRSALSDREMRHGINAILRFLNIKERIDPSLTLSEQLEDAESRLNLKYRQIELDDDWYERAVLPMLVMKKDGDYAAVIPEVSGNCRYISKNGECIITPILADRLTRNAICFYKSMDDRKVTLGRFAAFIIKTITVKDLICILAACAAAVTVGLILPWVNSHVFNHIIPSGEINYVTLSALILSAMTTITAMRLLQSVIMNNTLMRTDASMQSAVFTRLLSLRSGFFRDVKAGELSRIVMELSDFSKTLSVQSIVGLISVILSLIYLVQIHIYAPQMMGFVLLISLTLAILSAADSIISAKAMEKHKRSASEISGFCYELFSGIEQIKLNGSEAQMLRRWSEKYLNVMRNDARPLTIRYMSVVRLALTIVSTAVIFLSGTALSASNFIAFLIAYGAYLGAFESAAPIVYMTSSFISLYKLAAPLLNANCEEYGGEKLKPSEIKGNISVSNVSFSYGEGLPNVINDLSLEIRKGESIGIIGPSGCGKSTLIRLLLGFDTPTAGTISVDGYDLRELDLRSYRSLIGTVLQSSGLISGDIYSNITITKPDASLDEVKHAIDMAGLSEDIAEMPMGLHTALSASNNSAVSGGQLQRILIARALLPSPSLLILDEATSALDNLTQAKITEAINSLDCTKLIIAHRLSTIEGCDRILVMDEGRIVDEGTYDELMERNELFRTLTDRQRTE